MKVISEEKYLALNGVGRQTMGEPALAKNRGRNSDKVWSKMVNAQADKDWEIIEERDRLRKEYWDKVEAGELRSLTRVETLIETANGHPDREDTKAAIRLLTKRGIVW